MDIRPDGVPPADTATGAAPAMNEPQAAPDADETAEQRAAAGSEGGKQEAAASTAAAATTTAAGGATPAAARGAAADAMAEDDTSGEHGGKPSGEAEKEADRSAASGDMTAMPRMRPRNARGRAGAREPGGSLPRGGRPFARLSTSAHDSAHLAPDSDVGSKVAPGGAASARGSGEHSVEDKSSGGGRGGVRKRRSLVNGSAGGGIESNAAPAETEQAPPQRPAANAAKPSGRSPESSSMDTGQVGALAAMLWFL